MVDSGCGFSTLTNSGIGLYRLYAVLGSGASLELVESAAFCRADGGFGLSAENGIALYLYLEKTGQAGQAGSNRSAAANLIDGLQCSDHQYQISFTDRADPDPSARSGFDSGNRSKLAKCTLGD